MFGTGNIYCRLAETCAFCYCRPKYEQLLRELGVRPLKVQASRGVIVKLTEGSEVEVMGAEEAEAATL